MGENLSLRIAFKDHFSDRASAYASHRPVYPDALVDWLASLAPGRDLAWDAGCGSGQIAVPLARVFTRVIATDASADQIAHAAPHERIEYRVASAEQSGLADSSAEIAVAAQAAHWFDLPAYYREVRRVVRPGGVIALVTYNLLEAGDAVDRVLLDFYRSLEWPAERRLVEEGYSSIEFPFEEVRAPQFFMRAEWTVEDLFGFVRTWSALRNTDTIAFERAMRETWGDARRPVRWPIAMRVGRVE